jgi:hypothetical protein
MTTISVTDTDAVILRELLDAKLTDLRREISHHGFPQIPGCAVRSRGRVYSVSLAQIPATVIASA